LRDSGGFSAKVENGFGVDTENVQAQVSSDTFSDTKGSHFNVPSVFLLTDGPQALVLQVRDQAF
jgi:hypothetical protein